MTVKRFFFFRDLFVSKENVKKAKTIGTFFTRTFQHVNCVPVPFFFLPHTVVYYRRRAALPVKKAMSK